MHRRDQELIKAKKDAELAITQADSNEATLKKRFQEQLNEVNDQLERANKAKSKCVIITYMSGLCLVAYCNPLFSKDVIL